MIPRNNRRLRWRLSSVAIPLGIACSAVLSVEIHSLYLIATGDINKIQTDIVTDAWGYYSEGSVRVLAPPVSVNGYSEYEDDKSGDGVPDYWSVLCYPGTRQELAYIRDEKFDEAAETGETSFHTGDLDNAFFLIEWTKSHDRTIMYMFSLIRKEGKNVAYVDLNCDGNWDTTETLLRLTDPQPLRLRAILLKDTFVPVDIGAAELPLETTTYTVRKSDGSTMTASFEEGIWRDTSD